MKATLSSFLRSCLVLALFAVVAVRPAGAASQTFDPPAPIRIAAEWGQGSFELTQDIIGPEKPSADIIGPERTTLNRLKVCTPPDPSLPPGPCTQTNIIFKVTGANEVAARAGGLMVAVGALAGIIGPEVVAIGALQGLTFDVTQISGPTTVVGIIGPERAASLISASLRATAPAGICVISGPPTVCSLPDVFGSGMKAMGIGESCR